MCAMMTKIFRPRYPRQNACLVATATAIASCAIAVFVVVLVVDVVMVLPHATALAAAAPTTTTAGPTSRIAVLGATGNLGRQTIREFLDQEIPVRCLVRPSSLEKFPEEFKNSPLFEVVAGGLLATSSSSSSSQQSSSSSSSSDDSDSNANDKEGIFHDDRVAPSAELLECLEGCGGVVACYGATRRTKLSDLFRNPEDTDPTHAKQINYRSMIALVAACKAINKNANSDNNDANSNKIKIKHIVRITGKGEDPNGFFSILLNGLGAYCKAWNYQGEVVLRTSLAKVGGQDETEDDSIGYTIVRPGILKKEEDEETTEKNSKTTTKPPPSYTKDDLELADNGGNDLKVTPVGYSQIASLLVELVLSAGDGRISSATQNNRVTLAAMNPSDDDDDERQGSKKKSSLGKKIAALQNDRREFPASLVAEHKAAVKTFFTKVAALVSIAVIALVTLVSRIFF